MKVCSKCHIEKDEKGFYNDKRNSDGLQSQCKSCQCAGNRRWAMNNKERVRALSKKSRIKNKERVREQYNKWKKANIKQVKERLKEWRNKNKSKIIERIRVWRKKNPDRVRWLGKSALAKGRQTLSDAYVKRVLVEGQNVSVGVIKKHPELIEVKRTIIKIKRKLKNHVKENKKAN